MKNIFLTEKIGEKKTACAKEAKGVVNRKLSGFYSG
jgi:hypothetical protein